MPPGAAVGSASSVRRPVVGDWPLRRISGCWMFVIAVSSPVEERT
jgi:hypothetical protein